MNEQLLMEIKELEMELVVKHKACAYYYEHGTNPYMMEQMSNELADMEDLLQDLKEEL